MSGQATDEHPRPFRRWLAQTGTGIVDRLVRTRPDRLLPTPRVAAIASWIAGGVFAALALVVSFPPIPSSVDVAPLVLDAPAWFRVVAYLGAGVLAATLGVLALLLARPHEPASTVRAACGVAAAALLGVVPVLGLANSSAAGLAPAATAAVVVALVLGISAAVRGWTNGWTSALVAVATFTPWLLGTFTTADDAATDDPLWIVFSVVAVQSALILGYFGYSSGAVRRTGQMRPLLRRKRSRTLVTVALLIVAFVLVARLTFARDLFATPDPADVDDATLWSLRSPASWPLTLVIAGLIVWAALRSEHRPLRAAGFRRILLLETASWAVGAIALMVAALDQLVAPLAGRPAIDVGFMADWLLPIRLVATASAALFIVLPGFRGTSGRWIAIISLTYLVPGLAAPVFDALWPGGPAFWATPVPIVAAVTAIVAVIVVGQWFGAFPGVERSALLRLLIYPVVVLHAAALLPAALSGTATVLAVLLLIAQFVLLMPKVASDRVRHSRVVLRESSTALFAATALVLASQSGAWQTQATVFAILTLAIPVMTALVLRTHETRPSSPGDTAASEAPVELADDAEPGRS